MKVRAVAGIHELPAAGAMVGKIFGSYSADEYTRIARFREPSEGYRCEHTRIVEYNGKIVAHVLILPRTMRIGSRVVSMGGIAGVCTDKKYRMRGFGLAVMRDAVRYMRDEARLHTSLLFGIRDFYHRFGYAVVMGDCLTRISVKNCLRLSDEAVGFKARRATKKDGRAILRLHERDDLTRTGSIVRKPGDPLGPAQLLSKTTVIVDDRGRVRAYFVHGRLGQQWDIIEVGIGDRKVRPALLVAIGRTIRRLGQQDLVIHMPHDHPFGVFCASQDTIQNTHYTRNGGPMLAVLRLADTFQQVASELSLHLQRSCFAGWSGNIGIATEIGSVRLRVSKGEVSVVRPRSAPKRPDLRCSSGRVGQLLMGYSDIQTLAMESDVRVRKESIPIVNALFPKCLAYCWPADRF